MTSTTVAGGGLAHADGTRRVGLLAPIAQLIAWWDERRRIARTMAELEQLTDAELADIGISRADIERVARGAVRREA